MFIRGDYESTVWTYQSTVDRFFDPSDSTQPVIRAPEISRRGSELIIRSLIGLSRGSKLAVCVSGLVSALVPAFPALQLESTTGCVLVTAFLALVFDGTIMINGGIIAPPAIVHM